MSEQEQQQIQNSNNESEEKLSKNAQKKASREAKKAEAKASRGQTQQKQTSTSTSEDISSGRYGILPLINSATKEGKTFDKIEQLTLEKVDSIVNIRARVHSIRAKGNLVFIILRQRTFTVQAIASKGPETSKQFLKFLSELSKETIIDLSAKVTKAHEPVKSTTQQDVELGLQTVWVVSAAEILPILLEDAERPRPQIKAQKEEIKKIDQKIQIATSALETAADENSRQEAQKELERLQDEKSKAQKFVVLSQQQMLDNRVIDLRTPANQAIFTIQSGVCTLFREYLLKHNFIEIHTPKFIGAASEGGADVFKVPYFETTAYLAQSPQFYKQMAICSDMERVFEIAPVYRAEKSLTHRHMTEFIGLDLEMTFNEHYHEVLDFIGDMFVYIFDGLNERFSHELKIVSIQFPFEPLVYHRKTLRIEYKEAIQILREAGVEKGDLDDINTEEEKKLGGLVRQKYGTDFYIIDKFPSEIRPFYTLADPNDNHYSNSYDLFLRGQEIVSGAQRVHDPKILAEQAKRKNINLETIKDYINSFKYGAPPHAGGGVGLERVVMLFLGLSNIRKTSMFPRTPNRLTP